MPHIQAGQTNLYYEESGNVENPVVLMIMGLATQMTAWPVTLIDALASAGYRVITFDNRDTGLSEKFGDELPNLLKHLTAYNVGMSLPTPYGLNDLANDAVALLKALDIDKAHIVGASMGGMIGQLIAAHQPQITKSLVSIMSSTGNPRLPLPRKKIMIRMLKRPKLPDRESIIAHQMKTFRLFESPDYRVDMSELRQKMESSYDRAHYPKGYVRQLAAILACGDRSPLLETIDCPALVIHGKKDPLSRVEGGVDTAMKIKGAKLELIDGMGHNLPEPLVPTISGMIIDHLDRTHATPPQSATPP